MSSLMVSFVGAGATPAKRVAGLSLVERAIHVGRKAGFTRIAVACEPDDAEFVAGLDLDVTVLAGPEVDERLRSVGSERWVAVSGDRIWLPRGLEKVAAAAGELVISDDDATAERAGAVAAAAETLVDLDLANLDKVESDVVVYVGGEVVPVRTPAEVERATEFLLRSLTKSADGMVARHINRKISRRITARLVDGSTTPNQVTAVVFLIGVASLPLACLGTYWGFAAAGICYYVSAVLDGVDGEIARLKHLSSKLGAWLDTIVDDLVGLSWLIGLYYGLDLYADHSWWGWGGVLVIGLYLATILPRYYLMITRVGAGDHQQLAAQRPVAATPLSRTIDAVRDTVFRTDFLPFYAMVAAVAGIPYVFAITYGIGAAMAFIETLFTVSRAMRDSPGDAAVSAE